ncbi:MAG: CxxxxCH/CxxCH domain-containing protein [Lachnospiraceae bacterium]|nr:CxxxxCH/CxxCH domain-containing protein [Lachnospiraceae bacterium]
MTKLLHNKYIVRIKVRCTNIYCHSL